MPMTELPLAGVRVVDMSEQKLESTGRLLADFGADVIRVEPPDGAASRHRAPICAGVSIYFAVRNANKRGVTLDLASTDGQARLWSLLSSADIWIESAPPGALARYGFDPLSVHSRLPELVILSTTDFGQTGPYKDYCATDSVLLALGTQLSRCGKPGRPPLLPPGGMSYETSASQAALAVLNGYYQRLVTGIGDHLDFSIHESTLMVIDPPVGSVGTATAGAKTKETAAVVSFDEPRGRPTANPYPIFRCADGYVRILTLTPPQWRAIREWLGDPELLRNPLYETIRGREQGREHIFPLYAEFVRDRTMADLVHDGQARGVPIAPVMTTLDVLQEEHYEARGAFVEQEIAPGVCARVPSGFVEIDGERVGVRHRAPEVGEHNDEVFAQLPPVTRAPAARPAPTMAARLPLEGIRVCDFGAVVFGSEVGRLLADMGAEVIKVENSAFPDSVRQVSGDPGPMSVNFALANRNKQCIGLNLRSPRGVDVLKRIVAVCDVFMSNFKPGTLERLGVTYETLSAVNPRLVWMSASAVGHTGPWAHWLGYGPLVRCATGLTNLWRYPDDPASFSDNATIYPDHYGARVAAAAVVAGLIRVKRTGRGADIRASQAELVINQLAEEFVKESVEPGSSHPRGNTSDIGAPWGVYPCAGDDEWCVITVRDDDEWRRFVQAIGAPAWASDPRFDASDGRMAHRQALDALVSEWTGQLPPDGVMSTLQDAKIAAGKMVRRAELLGDPHLQARSFFAWLHQPELPAPIPMENRPFHALYVAAPPLRRAPKFGEHTVSFFREVVGMEDAEIEDLIAEGALEAAGAVEQDCENTFVGR